MITTTTRTALALRYGMSYYAFNKRIKDIEGLNLSPKFRLLSPRQVQLIYDDLGEPPK